MREIKHNNITWIDILNPSADDVVYIEKNFGVHPLAMEEFMTPTIRPRATRFSNCLFLTIHVPLFDSQTRSTFPGELDIVMTKDHLITGHKDYIYQLDQFSKLLEENPARREASMSKTPSHLLYAILQILMESCFPKLDHIVKNLDHIENEIFRGNEREMVREISVVKRDMLGFRRTLKPQRSILESILEMGILTDDLRPYYQDLIGTNIRIWNTLESTKETIESMEETNDSLLSNKLNSTMKVLTLFSAILLPMTVYSNIASMSTNIPFGHHPYGFWIHAAILLSIGLVTITIFKVKKWL